MNRHEIWEQFDVCPPEQFDLQAPEYAELRAAISRDVSLRNQLQRAQQADTRIRDSLRLVDPPSGLEARLLAALAEASRAAETERAASAVPLVDAPLADDGAVERAAPPQGRKASRRWWLIAACGSAAALLIVAWFGMTPPANVTPQELPELAIKYHREFTANGHWRPMTDQPPLGPARQLEQRLITGWLGAKDLFDSSNGLAFRLQSPTGIEATLYTAKGVLPGLASGPVAAQPVRTGGLWAAAWQSEGQMFVLVVGSPDPNAFRQFLPNRGGLAMNNSVQDRSRQAVL